MDVDASSCAEKFSDMIPQCARHACEIQVSRMNGKMKRTTRQGVGDFLTFAGRWRCERRQRRRRLPASQLSRVCRVPSSRSRRRRRSARGAAQSTGNFVCTHRTRSAVDAVPFQPRGTEGDKKERQKKEQTGRTCSYPFLPGDKTTPEKQSRLRREKVSLSRTGSA